MKRQLLIIIVAAVAGLEIAGVFCFLRNKKNGNFSDAQNSVSQNLPSDLASKNSVSPLPPKPAEISLIAVGDVMLSRGVAGKMRAKGMDYPFLKVKDYLKTGDIVFGNLETSITEGRKVVSGEMLFRADPGSETALKDAGFSVVSLANNHVPNFGQKAIVDTLLYLDQAGIAHCGAGKDGDEAGRPAYAEAEGIILAFLAYNDNDVVPASYEAKENHAGTAFINIEDMQKSVQLAKGWADFVIVSMHSGTEYTEKINQSQMDFAYAAIDAGAEMVIGHHPHIIQHVESYDGKYILFSLGNFVFDQMWSQNTREGMAANITFTKDGAQKIQFTPVLIDDYSQPRIVEGKEAESPFKKLKLDLDADNSISIAAVDITD